MKIEFFLKIAWLIFVLIKKSIMLLKFAADTDTDTRMRKYEFLSTRIHENHRRFDACRLAVGEIFAVRGQPKLALPLLEDHVKTTHKLHGSID